MRSFQDTFETLKRSCFFNLHDYKFKYTTYKIQDQYKSKILAKTERCTKTLELRPMVLPNK